MMDFLSEENVCGQSLLKLVSRGSAILAEMQRLSSYIPKVFYAKSDEFRKYEKILFNFEYLNNIDRFEDEIQSNQEIFELDENFKEAYLPLIERFYILFESIYLYYADLVAFVQELYDAVFIQYTVELLLQNFEGKKLFCEAFYLYGCMLILLDNLILGQIREKLVICYYRYKGGQSSIEFINQVCRLCRDTGYFPPQYNDNITPIRPQFYPEEYFARFEISPDLITELINAIKDDDIYKYMNAFPLAEQRSFALSTQASILYVLLYFNPKILIEQRAKMREIVDKHFNDNWVIPYYLGYYVDLSYQWEPYRAARLAIANTIDIQYIKENVVYFGQKMLDSKKKCEDYLIEGQIREEFVLDKVDKLMNCVRDCNISVRWLMLHRQTAIKAASDYIEQNINSEDILGLLLVSSKFESRLQIVFQSLLDTKQQRWDEDKSRCVERMNDLADYYSGKSLGRVAPDESYKNWFNAMGQQISLLEFNDSTYAGRKIQQFSKALEDIEQYPQIATSIQVKHYLNETRSDLKHMVRVVSIKGILLTHLSFISDISYSWQCLQLYKQLMQDKVKVKPQTALYLKTTFQKLSSILNTPMIRIIQANSPDINSVSKYYSGELIKFVKDVLQIIPIQIFGTLEDIITQLNQNFKAVPPKINKIELKDYAQFDQRTEMAQNTSQISVFTESILGVESYLLGVIEVNPKEILDQGLRRELIILIHRILYEYLQFTKGTIDDFLSQLTKLQKRLYAFRQSVEYIQDFINAFGNKMFIEEFERLVSAYITMECMYILTRKKAIEELSYDEDIPMPELKSEPPGCINFMGRLFRQIIALTEQNRTIYIESTLCFYDVKTQQEAFNLKTLNLLGKCIGPCGIEGIDRMLGYLIANELKAIMEAIKLEMTEENKKSTNQLLNQLKVLTTFSESYERTYSSLKKQFKNIINIILPLLQKVGQLILIRRLFSLQMQMSAKVGSSKLYLCLENLNDAILNDIKNREYKQDMETEEQLQMEQDFMNSALKLCGNIGLSDPLRKIYFTNKTPENLPIILATTIMSQLPLIDFDPKLNTLLRRNKSDLQLEPNYLIVGVVTLLNQFHKSYTDILVSYMGHYIKSAVNFLIQSKEIQKSPDQIGDVFTTLYIVEEIFRFKQESYENFKQLIPFGLLTNLSKQLLKTSSQVL